MNHLIDVFYANPDPSFAAWQKAYMRHQFTFLGLRQPLRKRLQKAILPLLQKSDILPLFEMKEREFQYAAMDLYLLHQSELTDLALLETMISTKSWWDTVDVIAANCCGGYFQHFRTQIPHTRQWLKSTNLWFRRSALLFQLRYKEKTDHHLLFDYCRTLASDPDPFIRRAIGWALREYGKTAPDKVVCFLAKERSKLSSLSFKEASYLLPPIQATSS